MYGTDIEKCIACGDNSDVIDSRPVPATGFRRRRRQCPHCKRRWSTFEVSEETYRVILATEKLEQLADTLEEQAKSLRQLTKGETE
jgi:transcriptional repressor NrdR